MTRASFRQADIERIIRAAEKTGASVQIDLRTLVATIFPGTGATPMLVLPHATLAPDGRENWDDDVQSDWTPIREGKGGYPIVDDPSHPMKQYYDKLGFDPRTMGESDMARLIAENRAEWLASIPGTKLGKRELAALGKLSEVGLDVHVPSTEIKGCGDDTMDRLEARAFIGRKQLLSEEEVKVGFSRQEIWLLKEGFDALNRLIGR